MLVACLWVLTLCLFAALCPVLYKPMWQDRLAMQAHSLVICVHSAVMILAIWVMNIPGMDADALSFHNDALEIVETHSWNWSAVGSKLYPQWVAAIYFLTGESQHIISAAMSIAAFGIGNILFYRLAQDHFSSPITRATALLAYGCLPSVILFTSTTLREPYMLLGTLLTLNGVRDSWRSYTYPQIAVSLIMIFCGSVLCLFSHKAMQLFAFASILLWLGFWLLHSLRRRSLVLLGIAFCLTAILGLALSNYLGMLERIAGSSSLKDILDGSLSPTAAIYAYRQNLLDGRTSYHIRFLEGEGGILKTGLGLLEMFWAYMVYPLPHQIKNAADTYAFLESVLRCALVFSSAYYAIKTRCLFAVYAVICALALEGLWSLGTASWGTGLRHHIIAYPVFVLFGMAGVMPLITKAGQHLRRFVQRQTNYAAL